MKEIGASGRASRVVVHQGRSKRCALTATTVEASAGSHFERSFLGAAADKESGSAFVSDGRREKDGQGRRMRTYRRETGETTARARRR